MASPHELSPIEPGSPYTAEVKDRTDKIAAEVAEEQAKQFARLLDDLDTRHPDLIDESAVASAIAKEKLGYELVVVQKREMGLMNDRASKQLGIFVTGVVEYEAF